MIVSGPELPAEQVIAWLRSPAGEDWTRWEYVRTRLLGHVSGSGVLAEVIPDIPLGPGKEARWPVPFWSADLDRQRPLRVP